MSGDGRRRGPPKPDDETPKPERVIYFEPGELVKCLACTDGYVAVREPTTPGGWRRLRCPFCEGAAFVRRTPR